MPTKGSSWTLILLGESHRPDCSNIVKAIPVSKLFWANIFSIVVSDVYAGECIDSGGYGFDTFGGERR